MKTTANPTRVLLTVVACSLFAACSSPTAPAAEQKTPSPRPSLSTTFIGSNG